MIAGLFAGVLLPVAATAAVVRAAAPDLWAGSRTLVLSLGVVVALGVSSVLFAAGIFAFGPRWAPYVACETVLWLVLLAVALRAGAHRPAGSRERRPFTAAEVVAAAVFTVTLTVSLLHFYWTSANFPSGEWDAQAIWTLRARFLHRGLDGHWRDGFLPVLAWSLPDYPLMLSSSIARLWTFTGAESRFVPALLAGLFKYATVGMIVGGLMALRGRWEAFCGGALVLSTLGFNVWGAGQIADVPLGAFLLASTILLSRMLDLSRVAAGTSALVTFCAGCAAWTKNEGVIFAGAACAALAVLLVWRRHWRLRTLLAACGGLLLPAAALVYFKRNIAPPNYLFDAANLGTVTSKLWDPERHAYILDSFGRELWSWNGAESTGAIPLAVAYALGASVFHGFRGSQLIAVMPVAAMLSGYYASYVFTPFDLKWHVTSSLARLIVQVWPAIVYTCFSVADAKERTVDEH